MDPIIRTYTGKEVNPLDLHVEDICIEDIAHSLSLINRFNGHTIFPISVAQHSVFVSRLCEEQGEGLEGLLHDAAEAYLGDVTKWLKQTPEMKAFRDAEDSAQTEIANRFGISEKMSELVDWADRVMVRWEGLQGFGPKFRIGGGVHPNYPKLTAAEIKAIGLWIPWSWKIAEQQFLTQFNKIGLYI